MSKNELYTLGIDIGSTTVKIAILDKDNDVAFSDYERHYANIQETLSDLLGRAIYKLGGIYAYPVITGSGGLTLAKHLDVPFVQEVIAVSTALQDYAPQTDVAIELGGEDAKIIYFEGGNVEQRMNGVCAGGTGSFIDQMASLLQTDASGLNEYAKNYKSLYSIAARCGVFAKSDIQPLINDGASKEDLAASIFQAVVNQTISGLACGKPIRGHVAFLGGPLHFLSELKEAFVRTLKLDDRHTIAPNHSHLFAAIGSAMNSKRERQVSLQEMQSRLEKRIKMEFEVDRMEPLFTSEADFHGFEKRHARHQVPVKDLASYTGKAFLGIDAGSTTTKAALVGDDGTLLYSFYHNNEGDPLGTTIMAIKDIYSYMDCQGTTMLSIEDIEALEYSTTMAKCKGCTNNCRLTINHFSGGRKFITGNRCERGLGKEKADNKLPNLFEYKLHRYFDYTPLEGYEATRGVIGIPRVLNMYENYPFWFTFFHTLGFQVVLSPASTRKIYELGIESIPSESECYPAKLAHGHVQWLINQGIHRIFYPSIPYERNEFQEANNHYNCPIVTSYPENIKNNIDAIVNGEVEFLHPFLSLKSEETISYRLVEELSEKFSIPASEIRSAVHRAWDELLACREDMKKKGEETIEFLNRTGNRGIVLAGRPYHIDPEVNHGIPELVNSYNIAVLTEDSVSHLHPAEHPLNVMDQWMYHSRLYGAANFVKTRDNLDLIQLNSFGCGLDAVTTDQVASILNDSDKIYTSLKIDEVNNLGAARIRVRSLLAAIRVREKRNEKRTIQSSAVTKVPFTQEMRKDYTILCPQMSPIHFDLLEPAFAASGYNIEILPNDNKQAVDVGLKYVNNDACYPSLMVVGQIMDAILSGRYDTDKIAVIISQTGGGCRASNYIGFIRRALKKAGYEHIPVISVNLSGLEGNPGFKLTPRLIMRSMYAIVLGDIFMKCVYRIRPYEAVKGSADAMHEKWVKVCKEFLSKGYPSRHRFKRLCKEIIEDFDKNIELLDVKKPRVGVVGEILVKFLPAANNYLVELLESEGAEAVVPDLLDFLLYCFYNQNFKVSHLGMKKSKATVGNLGIKALEWFRAPASKAFKESRHFDPPADIKELGKMASDIVSLGNQTGEGWFLTGEMLELIHSGAPNIVCTQPFACLPNHVVGKGVIKELRRRYPESNIVAIDFDPGASEVNQLNRIKLMLSTANKNMKA